MSSALPPICGSQESEPGKGGDSRRKATSAIIIATIPIVAILPKTYHKQNSENLRFLPVAAPFC